MTPRLLSPHSYKKLKTKEEKYQAYSDLWDAWQQKGVVKKSLSETLREIRDAWQRGNQASNEADFIISETIIKIYWELKHSLEHVTASILYDKQLDIFRPNEFTHGSVVRWNTALRSVWQRQKWLDDLSQFETFKSQVWEEHRFNIGTLQRPR